MKMFKISKMHREMVKVVVMLTMLAKKYKFVEMDETQIKNECLITDEMAYMFKSHNGLFVLWIETRDIVEKTMKLSFSHKVNGNDSTEFVFIWEDKNSIMNILHKLQQTDNEISEIFERNNKVGKFEELVIEFTQYAQKTNGKLE
jgi:hypothetical protein